MLAMGFRSSMLQIMATISIACFLAHHEALKQASFWSATDCSYFVGALSGVVSNVSILMLNNWMDCCIFFMNVFKALIHSCLPPLAHYLYKKLYTWRVSLPVEIRLVIQGHFILVSSVYFCCVFLLSVLPRVCLLWNFVPVVSCTCRDWLGIET